MDTFKSVHSRKFLFYVNERAYLIDIILRLAGMSGEDCQYVVKVVATALLVEREFHILGPVLAQVFVSYFILIVFEEFCVRLV